MQGLNSSPSSQMSLQDLQNGQHHHQQIAAAANFDPTSSPTNDNDFLHQMLSSCWPDLAGVNPKSPWDISSNTIAAAANNKSDDQRPSVLQHQFGFDNDQSAAALSAKLRNQQIGGSGGGAKSLLLQHQMMLQSRGGGLRPSDDGDSGLLSSMPLRLGGEGVGVDVSSFTSPNPEIDGSVQALYNGLLGSLHGNGHTSNHFHHTQEQNYGVAAAAAVMSQSPAASGSAGGGAAVAGQPRQRVRARRGQATDPHSIAERLRRERIAERMKALQELVPNGNKTDKASMLDEIIDYVKFLQLQVKVLSMSRLGGAAAVAPLVADFSSQGGGDCIQASRGGRAAASASNDSSMTVVEHQVAKLMEEDTGSAMQYLQGKGLCLMPISLATAISTATSQSSRNPSLAATAHNHPLLLGAEGVGGPSSPNMSVLTVQSAASMGNGGGDHASSVKDATSVSKP